MCVCVCVFFFFFFFFCCCLAADEIVSKAVKMLHYNRKNKLTNLRFNVEMPKIINFPFVPNGKLMVLR